MYIHDCNFQIYTFSHLLIILFFIFSGNKRAADRDAVPIDLDPESLLRDAGCERKPKSQGKLNFVNHVFLPQQNNKEGPLLTGLSLLRTHLS